MALERGVTIVSSSDLPNDLVDMEEHYIASNEVNRDSYRSWDSFRHFVDCHGNTKEISILKVFETVEFIDPPKTYLHFS